MDVVKEIVQLAQHHRVAAIRYRKHATRELDPLRLVEPYNFTQGKQDMMIRCFQIEPKPGWRFFMIHKIDEVKDAGQDFHPRVKITLSDGDIDTRYRDEVASVWREGLQQYRDMVSDALADGFVSRSELKEIDKCKRAHSIRDDEAKYVHISLYHRCLGAVLDDEKVDNEEIAQIRFLHRVLSQLGWSIED